MSDLRNWIADPEDRDSLRRFVLEQRRVYGELDDFSVIGDLLEYDKGLMRAFIGAMVELKLPRSLHVAYGYYVFLFYEEWNDDDGDDDELKEEKNARWMASILQGAAFGEPAELAYSLVRSGHVHWGYHHLFAEVILTVNVGDPTSVAYRALKEGQIKRSIFKKIYKRQKERTGKKGVWVQDIEKNGKYTDYEFLGWKD